MVRRANRVDSNHKEIIDGLRKRGAEVLDISSVKNAFDILVSYNGKVFCVEIKNPEYVKPHKYWDSLTEGEKKFHEKWKAEVYIVTELEELIDILNKETIGGSL
jgi:Holliday junction resolvase